MTRTTIVIPARNDAARLQKLLGSLAPTDFEQCEVLVVDDGSTDDTARVAGSFPVRVIRNERSLGPAAARNRGVEEAAGDIVIFLDSDVVLAGGLIDRMLDWFARDHTLAGVSTVTSPVPENKGWIPLYCAVFETFATDEWIAAQPEPNEHGGYDTCQTIITRCGAIRKDVFQDVGGFDTDYTVPCLEDVEFSIRLAGKGHRMMLDPGLSLTHHWPASPGALLRRNFRNARIFTRFLASQKKSPAAIATPEEGRRRAIAASGVFLAGSGVLWPSLFVAGGVLVLVALLLYRKLFASLLQAGGLAYMLVCVPVHFAVCATTLLAAATALPGIAVDKIRG